PSEGDSPVGEGILTGGGLGMLGDLLGRGLADIDDGLAIGVPGPELGGAQVVSHGRLLRDAWPRGCGRAAGRASRGAGAAGPPAGGATAPAGWTVSPVASCAGGSDGADGVGHGVSPVVKQPRCRHHAASSSNAVARIVTGCVDA